MNHGKIVSHAVAAGLAFVIIALLAWIGVPMIEMLRAHLGM
jgi:hypothetical protein